MLLQVEALMRQHGMSVVLVTSGAVCVGQQKLGYQQMLHTSPLDRLNNQTELHGKACAAIGQNGLMSLYETLFHQLDIPCSQLLVTDRDFANPEFREQLKATVSLTFVFLLSHSFSPCGIF
ncbi:hypothetical protein CBR_g41475 [Chara braunii]|uniref:Aspartate/glutamate/uridylate kinase domain-containing protein n=1 Tax=Chara braunii TaxID=69332 RepID=A0A388LVX4_CHABU|nr:hypothetical protein CBR_g41475 [Chara braunii]|eukprot:GBG86480.1 hypothetical protein CBR_g41475 [Chara braunii]